MSNQDETDDIPIEIEENPEKETQDKSMEEIKLKLEEEKQKAQEFEDKFKRALADYLNLERKSQIDIENGVNSKIDKFILEFLTIYDDFIRAKESYAKSNIDTKGLDSILKNMNALLNKFNIVPIVALGEIFDPKLHEAISIKNDSQLDEGTITKEIRKGYISHNRVIRPTLVEISKKS